VRIVRTTAAFERDLKRVEKQGKNTDLLFDLVEIIQNGEPLPAKCKDHPLHHDKAGKRDCHISPDWLLIYERN